MKNVSLKFHNKKISFYSVEGFAIPQILILGIGIALGVSGLMAASILGLTGSRINRQELLAKSSSYSGITRLRSLLNDNTRGKLLNYFWLVNNCSEKSGECDQVNISIPANEYWSDDAWCNGEENCNGRQKAPVCTPYDFFSWNEESQIVSQLFSDSNYVGNNLENSKRNFEQTFNVISTKYIGTEEYGINSILIEGLASPKNSLSKSASNKLRVNIQVNGDTTESGFGFISVGENDSDKTDSLFLGNLNITPFNNAKGSIIWRMNTNNIDNCNNLKELAKGENSSLPQEGNGGIWVQPISLPKQPRLSNVIDLGTLICTEENISKNDSNCRLDGNNKSQNTFRIYSLYAKGPGSQFEISTTDENKIILEIMGDIDISNEGKFCHKNGLESCGTGKPENLTILFKQKTRSEQTKLFCNRDNNEGGIRIKNNTLNTDSFPLDNDYLPGHSFLIDNTGMTSTDKLGAFIYGPKLTFLSVLPKSKWIQINAQDNDLNSGMIVTSRGVYGYVKNTSGESIEDKITNLILTSEMKLIPYGSEDNQINNIEVIAIGEKTSQLPSNTLLDRNTNNVFLIFNNLTGNYHLRSFTLQNINRFNNQALQNAYPGSFAILNSENNLNDVNLGDDLEDNPLANELLNIFDIQLKLLDKNVQRNFTGAVWVKNLCLDGEGEKNWEFSKTFIDKLVAWHGDSFNWGIKYYRGQSIILWDTLRDFNPN